MESVFTAPYMCVFTHFLLESFLWGLAPIQTHFTHYSHHAKMISPLLSHIRLLRKRSAVPKHYQSLFPVQIYPVSLAVNHFFVPFCFPQTLKRIGVVSLQCSLISIPFYSPPPCRRQSDCDRRLQHTAASGADGVRESPLLDRSAAADDRAHRQNDARGSHQDPSSHYRAHGHPCGPRASHGRVQ